MVQWILETIVKLTSTGYFKSVLLGSAGDQHARPNVYFSFLRNYKSVRDTGQNTLPQNAGERVRHELSLIMQPPTTRETCQGGRRLIRLNVEVRHHEASSTTDSGTRNGQVEPHAVLSYQCDDICPSAGNKELSSSLLLVKKNIKIKHNKKQTSSQNT